MKIGDAANRADIPAHRLRHYESTGLLVPERSGNGYREYTDEHVERAKQIKALLDSGFTTADIDLMLPCITESFDDDRRCCAVTRGHLSRRLEVIRDRRRQLERTEAAITEWLA